VPQSTGSWHDRAPQPGDAALALLAPEWTVGIVGELARCPLRPAELERRLAGAPHATLMDRLGDLSGEEIVVRERLAGDARGAKYALTERGRGLEEIVAAAALIERERPDAAAGDRPAGERTLRLVADPYNRAITRVLADGSQTLAEIERGLPGLAHSSVDRQLRELRQAGVVAVGREPSGRTPYELVLDGRRLALLVLLAARWERRLAPRAQMATDVGGLVHMIAPLAQIAPVLQGACRLHVEGRPGEPDIHLSVGKGRISALALAPAVAIDAHGDATAEQWGRALLRRDPAGIVVRGDSVLLGAVVVALGAALHA
jgi:DNA-binding HxlR family transcriptional regulator